MQLRVQRVQCAVKPAGRHARSRLRPCARAVRAAANGGNVYACPLPEPRQEEDEVYACLLPTPSPPPGARTAPRHIRVEHGSSL